jgi:hypothetical protein
MVTSALRRAQAPAAQHEVAVLQEVRQEPAARLASRHPDRDDAVDALDGRFLVAAHGDHGEASSHRAQRVQLAFDARVRRVVTVHDVQDVDGHDGQLKVVRGHA